nr:tetranectin-like [Penaeus vannamei]
MGLEFIFLIASSLTDHLLLRQEAQLNRMAAAQEARRSSEGELETFRKAKNNLPLTLLCSLGVVCVSPFTQVGGSCLLLALNENHTWASARQFCAGYGADLAHFSDVNTYAAILEYIKTISMSYNLSKNVNIWIGESDEAVEGTWVWVTGELMPAGAPFWGNEDGYESDGFDKGDFR